MHWDRSYADRFLFLCQKWWFTFLWLHVFSSRWVIHHVHVNKYRSRTSFSPEIHIIDPKSNFADDLLLCDISFTSCSSKNPQRPETYVYANVFINWKLDTTLVLVVEGEFQQRVVKGYSNERVFLYYYFFFPVNNWDCLKRTNRGMSTSKNTRGRDSRPVWVSRTEQRDFDRFPS